MLADATAPMHVTATAATLGGDATRTTFRLDLSDGVTAEIFTLADPYRVIVDLPDVSFRMPEGAGQEPFGLVKAFRYGLFAERKARIVIDTTGPVRIERAAMTAAGKGPGIICHVRARRDSCRKLRAGHRRLAPRGLGRSLSRFRLNPPPSRRRTGSP